jgi:hypothetical protein
MVADLRLECALGWGLAAAGARRAGLESVSTTAALASAKSAIRI